MPTAPVRRDLPLLCAKCRRKGTLHWKAGTTPMTAHTCPGPWTFAGLK